LSGHSWDVWDRDLVLDLRVVADCVPNEIILNYAIDEWLGAVRVTQVDSRPCAQNLVVTNRPSPCGCFRGDADGLLVSILSDQGVAFDTNVVRQVPCATFGADSEGPLNATTVNAQVLDGDEAAVHDF